MKIKELCIYKVLGTYAINTELKDRCIPIENVISIQIHNGEYYIWYKSFE